MSIEPHYSASDLARWGLLEGARREAARDQLIAREPLPPPAVFEVLLSQWAQAQGLGSQAAVESWLAERGLAAEDLQALVARPWRWQQWCERQGGAAGLRFNTDCSSLLTLRLSCPAGLWRWFFQVARRLGCRALGAGAAPQAQQI